MFFFKFIMIRLLSRHHPAANHSRPSLFVRQPDKEGGAGRGWRKLSCRIFFKMASLRLPLPCTDTQQIGLNTAGRGPSPRAVIARSVCVPGWNGGDECGIRQVSGCAEPPVKLPSSERDSAKVPFCLLWVNRARETFIIDQVCTYMLAGH